MIAAMMATVDSGRGSSRLRPFYENYAAGRDSSDARPRHVLASARLEFRRSGLRAAFNSGRSHHHLQPEQSHRKVFTRAERSYRRLCQEFDALCFTDEIYEHILYPREGAEIAHISMAQIEGMRDRTESSTRCPRLIRLTGWRVLLHRRAGNHQRGGQVHDFLTVGAAAPLQSSGAYACLCRLLLRPIAKRLSARRDLFCPNLRRQVLELFLPMAHIIYDRYSALGF